MTELSQRGEVEECAGFGCIEPREPGEAYCWDCLGDTDEQ